MADAKKWQHDGATEGLFADRPAEAGRPAGSSDASGCDTANVFAPPAPPNPTLDYQSLAREAARIRAEAGREISKHLMESKREIYLRRKEIGQEVFDKVRERIAQYTASPEYPEHLKELLLSALKQLPGATRVSLRLRQEDLPLGPELAKAAAPVKVEYEEGSFSLGGLAIRCPELGLRVDCSFDNRLEELSSHFAESFGLSLSDDEL